MVCGSGFYIGWYAGLHAIHKSQKAIIANSNLNKKKLVEFVVSKSGFKKTFDSFFDNDENEFEFDGRMYDVVSQKIIGDSIHISAISDTEEDNLRELAVCYIVQGKKNTTGRDLPLVKFRLDLFANDLQISIHGFSPLYNLPKFRHGKAPGLICPYFDISAPPPRFTI